MAKIKCSTATNLYYTKFNIQHGPLCNPIFVRKKTDVIKHALNFVYKVMTENSHQLDWCKLVNG